ncbi:MAG: type VI secretion system baseplate subunit TssK [Pseudomonadota bacterium]|nr:type VI secretion system baseplate subunit TssK [Pseudomonadota bacterium]
MSNRHRVIWSQGMFLQPHHFQQETRFLESLLDARVRASGPYAWGFDELVIDDAQLALGRLAITRASGVLPDGTPFNMPEADALPAPMAVPPDLHNELIHLAAPQARIGVTEVDFGDGKGSHDAAEGASRYRVIDAELRDLTNAADDPEPVQTGAVNFRLLRARDLTDAYATLGTVRVVERRDDNQVVLDRGYIAPQTRIDATAQLSASAALLHGLVQQRARALAGQLGQLGQGVSEIADFMMLVTLNRAEPLLRQYAAAPSAHPWPLYMTCLQLAGEMASFNAGQRHPPEYPVYRHDDLQRVFPPVLQDLREMLSTVIERHAVQIELVDRNHGVRTAVVADAELMRKAGFVLAVRSQLPIEQLRQRFPAQSKLGPVDRIKDLVNLQLPGVGLRSLPVAPRQLPFHSGSHYFELERQGELWKQIERSGNLVLHVGGEFPGLELELWAIRQA